MVERSRPRPAGRRRSGSDEEPKLPRGAEAALLSILEVVPDPRNALALTRDLSGEVRITDLDRAEAAALAEAPRAPAPEAPAACEEPSAGAHPTLAELLPPLDSYYELGVLAENESLTDHLFTSAES